MGQKSHACQVQLGSFGHFNTGPTKKTLTLTKFWVIYKVFILCFCNGYQKSINYRILLIFVSKKGNQPFVIVASINSENTKHGLGLRVVNIRGRELIEMLFRVNNMNKMV